jgi:hypothetical protein
MGGSQNAEGQAIAPWVSSSPPPLEDVRIVVELGGGLHV